MRLHDYWRSGTSYRVRIALNHKGLAYERVPIDLRAGTQRDASYLALNPQGLVPTLEVGTQRLMQSPAILEWLEEAYPEPPLLPGDPGDRAIVRAMAAAIGCDIHPLNNLRVLNSLREDLGATSDEVKAWTARWIAAGFAALETLVARHGGACAFGDAPTMADVYLVPQVYSARRFGVDLTPYPLLRGVSDRAAALPAFVAAHPDRQVDADPA